MAQYWLQVPVENAKEVVQRYIDNSGTLSSYAGAQVTYSSDCEVILYYDDLVYINNNFNSSVIYFGTYIQSKSSDGAVTLRLNDGFASINIIDGNTVPLEAQSYPYLIWNEVSNLPASENNYFIGYKFDLI